MAGPQLRNTFSRLAVPARSLLGSGHGILSQFRSSVSSFFPSSTSTPTLTPRAPFSTSSSLRDWLIPRTMSNKRSPKGRPRVSTGGSMRGTTVVWGDYGLRMTDRHRRITSNHLRMAIDTFKQRFRGMEYQIYTRVAANISVAISGNEVRMGKGKGTHDHWVARVAVNQVVFEIKTKVHEQVVKDAFRVAGAKLPGTWEMAKRGDEPYMGMTQLGDGVTIERLMKPRRSVSDEVEPAAEIEAAAAASSPSPSSSALSGAAA